ncbi:hypothetical protein D9757_012631 [Collybiopsis confluens]|uniref:FAD/NAD(P)-binding domain-containing protein n=1 Tax=Collybiopsis confluens TaxID=2823264 RepID=A0A8H5D0S7_9AGAR|nr:hypothetical protein D9757_012631 [Collybiopsis confluens]
MSEESAFDVIIVGTGLTESITAAALSKAGFKVAHVDENPYYGGDEASLTLDEYVKWVGKSSSEPVLPNSRLYTISLSPSVIPATGPLISSLVGSGVSRYGGFRLIEAVAVYRNGRVQMVPGSKEDIFKDKSISLLDKRRLMRFLVFASGSGEFEDRKELEGGKGDMPFVDFLKSSFALNQEMADAIAYALSFCTFTSDKTLPALYRLRRYLRSAGRYGSSPFLIGHYGSSGEIAQGFCRAAAVSGGVYILGKRISSITRRSGSDTGLPSQAYTVTLSDFPEPITCDLLICSQDRLPQALSLLNDQVKRLPSEFPFPPLSQGETIDGLDIGTDRGTTIARCICIIDKPLSLTSVVAEATVNETEGDSAATEPRPALDTGILVFPPSSLAFEGPGEESSPAANGTVTALVVGEGTLSVPKGKWIIYLTMPLATPLETTSPEQDAERLLKPYLDTVLSLSAPTNSLAADTASSSPEPPPSAPTSSVDTETGSEHATSPASTPLSRIDPLFTSFYIQRDTLTSTSSSTSLSSKTEPVPPVVKDPSILIVPSPLLAYPSIPADTPNSLPNLNPLPDVADAAAANAEVAFREAIRVLKGLKSKGREGQEEGGVEEGGRDDIESFWPPLADGDGDEDEDEGF